MKKQINLVIPCKPGEEIDLVIKFKEDEYKDQEIKPVKSRQRKPKGCWYNPARNKWHVKCVVNGRRESFGYYENVYEAMAVYEKAKQQEKARKQAPKGNPK